MPRLVHLLDLPYTPWPSGTGGSREIAYAPDGNGAWDWRLQLAHVAADMPSPADPGTHRSSVVVAGAGMSVALAGGTTTVGHGECLHVPGGRAGSITLTDGEIQLLHLHAAHGVEATLDLIELDGETLIPPDTIAVVVTSNGIRARSEAGTPSVMQPLDAVIVTRQPLRLFGQGAVARVRTPIPSAPGVRFVDPALLSSARSEPEWRVPFPIGSGPFEFPGRMTEAH